MAQVVALLEFFTLVSLIFSTCLLALRRLKYKTPAKSPSAPPLHPAWLMEVCTTPYQQHLTWLPNHQHYTCCNNLTVIVAPPGLLISTIHFLFATISLLLQPHLGSCPPPRLQNGHVICHTLDDTNIPPQSSWTSCRTDSNACHLSSAVSTSIGQMHWLP